MNEADKRTIGSGCSKRSTVVYGSSIPKKDWEPIRQNYNFLAAGRAADLAGPPPSPPARVLISDPVKTESEAVVRIREPRHGIGQLLRIKPVSALRCRE